MTPGTNGSSGYAGKFSDFIKLLKESPEELVIIHNADALGDNYEELIESLNWLADADKMLKIVPRKGRGGTVR